MSRYKVCLVCGSIAYRQLITNPIKFFYDCPVCGRYLDFPMFADVTAYNLNHLAPYLAYSGFLVIMEKFVILQG